MISIEYIGKSVLVGIEGRRILALGDLHIGYEEALNRAGVFVSRTVFRELISTLDQIFQLTGNVDEVVLLGDIKHTFGNVLRQEWKEVGELISYLHTHSASVVLIKGNHDSILDPLVRNLEVQVHNCYRVGSVCFLHGDQDFVQIHERSVSHWIMGHGHPAVTLYDGVKAEKYKSFLVGTYRKKQVIIVPSFTTHTEGSDPREHNLGLAWDFPLDKFQVKIVGENLEVLDFETLGKIKA